MAKPTSVTDGFVIVVILNIVWIVISAFGYVHKEKQLQYDTLKTCVEQNQKEPLTCFTEKKNE